MDNKEKNLREKLQQRKAGQTTMVHSNKNNKMAQRKMLMVAMAKVTHQQNKRHKQSHHLVHQNQRHGHLLQNPTRKYL